MDASSSREVTVAVDDLPERDSEEEPDLLNDTDALSDRRVALKIRSTAPRSQQTIRLSRQGGLDLAAAEFASRRWTIANREAATNVHFISTESFNGNELIRHWDRIQLTPDEALVLQALRFVDGSIEDIRSFGSGSIYGPEEGLLLSVGESRAFPTWQPRRRRLADAHAGNRTHAMCWWHVVYR